MAKKEKNKSYLEVYCELRKNLELYADDRHCLLPELVLCERLSASRGTLRKALDELRSSAFIVTEKRRNYIKNPLRKMEIGILMDCFKPAPYLPEAETVSSLVMELEKSGYHGRLLVPADLKNIPDLVKQYDLKGLAWFNPPENMLAAVVDMLQQEKINYSCLVNYYELSQDAPLTHNYVAMDKVNQGSIRANFCLERGGKKAIWLGLPDQSYTFYLEEMKKNGVKPPARWQMERLELIHEKLAEVIEKDDITAITASGGMVSIALFEVLMNNKALLGRDLDILMPNTIQVRRMIAKYPEVKITKLADLQDRIYGTEMIRMLIRRIEQNQDQEPVLIKSKLISPQANC